MRWSTGIRCHCFKCDVDVWISAYGMSEQQKEMKVRRISVMQMRRQEEKERTKQEDEEKKKAADKSFKVSESIFVKLPPSRDVLN